MKIFNLDTGDCDCSPIEIFTPVDYTIQVTLVRIQQGGGGGGGAIVDVGSKDIPILITSALPAPANQRQRTWCAGDAEPVVNPSLPSSTVGDEWWIATTDETNTISFEYPYPSGLQLSGPWTGGAGSILYLQSDSNGGWIEGGRNEI